MRVYDITPQFIDSWIDWLRSTRDQFHQSKLRTSFDHELSVMRSVLLYYRNYYDDPHYQFPVKSRHAEDSRIGKAPPKTKDLTEAEFLRFHARLSETKLGCLLAPMATVQFYQALRISEAAGLFFEDLNLNFRNPSESTIRVSRHVIYLRGAHSRTEILPGFKNSGGGEYAIKELHLFPESFEALKSVFKVGARGIVFSTDGKTPLSYRKIQNAYDLAFRKAGLPYRGTHVLRHGGCRRVYNATGGDIALAQQLLGNSDLESTLVYAKRDRNALKTLVQSKWQ
jgi:integrase